MATSPAAAPVAQNQDTAQPKSGERRGPLLLQVVRVEQLAPSLLRIILGGEALADYPADAAGAHIKVLIPRPGQEKPLLPILGEGRPKWDVPQEERPSLRTYTIRSVDTAKQELALEFVVHDHGGPAATWARNAEPGAWIGISAPGSQFAFPANCDWHLFAGDATALPGIAARLERLPENASGVALIEVADAGEIIELSHPVGIHLQWYSLAEVAAGRSPVADAVLALNIPATAAIYAAGEAASMSTIRNHVRQTLGIPRDQVYVIPYWKQGANEEIYHNQRHEFMDADE